LYATVLKFVVEIIEPSWSYIKFGVCIYYYLNKDFHLVGTVTGIQKHQQYEV